MQRGGEVDGEEGEAAAATLEIHPGKETRDFWRGKGSRASAEKGLKAIFSFFFSSIVKSERRDGMCNPLSRSIADVDAARWRPKPLYRTLLCLTSGWGATW